jgi:hypothetical protein
MKTSDMEKDYYLHSVQGMGCEPITERKLNGLIKIYLTYTQKPLKNNEFCHGVIKSGL